MIWFTAWLVPTAFLAAAQAIENMRFGRQGAFWATVWWTALTWPVWIVVIALDIGWGPHWGRRK